MFVSQKLLTPGQPQSSGDGKKKDGEENPMAGMTQSMQYTMPLMFGLFSLQFPAGLSLYFVISNIIGIGQGYLIRQSKEDVKPSTKTRGESGSNSVEAGEPEPSSADKAVATSDNGQKAGKKTKRSKRKRR
jgi:YidC/Oxa1 family membrane protein insertase